MIRTYGEAATRSKLWHLLICDVALRKGSVFSSGKCTRRHYSRKRKYVSFSCEVKISINKRYLYQLFLFSIWSNTVSLAELRIYFRSETCVGRKIAYRN